MTRRKKILAWLMILILSVASFVQPLFAGTAEEQEITFRITAGAGKISVKDSGYNILEVQGDSPEEKTGIFERGEKLQVQITPKEGWELESWKELRASEEEYLEEIPKGKESFIKEISAGEIKVIEAAFIRKTEEKTDTDSIKQEESQKQEEKIGEKELTEKERSDADSAEEETKKEEAVLTEEKEESTVSEESEDRHTENQKQENTQTENSEEKDEAAEKKETQTRDSLKEGETENQTKTYTGAEREQIIKSFKVSREIAPHGNSENVYLTVGDRAYYEDYYTHFFDVNGSTAYCLEPSKLAPASGNYTTTEMGTGLLRKTMYYVYGGPGYEIYRENFGNIGSIYYSIESEYCMSHCLVSFAYTGTMDAFTGLGEQTKNELLAELENIKSLPDPPSSFEAFYFNLGNESYQTMGGSWPLEYGNIEIRKSSGEPDMTEGNTEYSLEGAKYEISRKDTGEKAGEVVLDKEGKGKSGALVAGEYQIRETQTPKGYIMNRETGTVTVTAGKTIIYNCTDISQKGIIRLRKIDEEESGKSLKGAVYEVRKKNGGLMDTLTTDQQGKAQSKELPLGVYTVKEKTAPSGYLLDTKTYTVAFQGDTSSEEILYQDVKSRETSQKGKIRLTKQDSETGGKPSGEGTLKGAEYGVYNSSGQLVDTLETDENGKAQSQELPLGTYTVKETISSPGYIKDNKTYTVSLSAESGNSVAYADITSKEPPQKGIIRLEKKDADTQKNTSQGEAQIKGAVYTVRDSSNQTVDTLTTGEDGKAQSRELPLGTYTVKETKPAPGYTLDTASYTVKFTSENRTSTVFYKTVQSKESVIRGGVSVEKWDSEKNKREAQGGASLEGAQIQIVSKNQSSIIVEGKTYGEGEVVATLITDKDGKAKTSADFLPYGNYQLKEAKPPKGYTASGTLTRNFSVRENGKIVEMNTADTAVKNQVIRGGVSVEKWDSEKNKREAQGGASLEGAQIQILSRNQKSILVDGKTYQTGEVITTLTTDRYGKAKTGSGYLPYGDYQLKEIKPPAGYTGSGILTRNFSIRENGKMVEMNTGDTAVKNKVIRGGIAVEKWDTEKNENLSQGAASLEGARFQVISMNPGTILVEDKEYKKGEAVAVLTTDKTGKAATEKELLPYGDYQLKEITPPQGYNPTGVVCRDFSIREQGKLVQMTTSDTAIKNDVIRGDVQLVKFGADQEGEESEQKKPLKGICFTFTSKTTGMKYTIVTDENGYASTRQLKSSRGGLIYDTYVVTEDSPYDEYAEIEPFEITISEEGKTLYYILENDVIEAPVSIVKKDKETGRVIPVKGASFQILDQEKEPVKMTVTHYPSLVVQDTWETDETGSFLLPEKLKPGIYYLKETEAPKGYLKGELLEFSVDGDYEWSQPLTVEYSDVPVKGKILIEKSDALSGEKLAGAVFEIIAGEDIRTPDSTVRAKKGEIVDTVTADDAGNAVSKELYLGKYLVREVKPAPGFVLSEKRYEAELLYKDQDTALVTDTLEIRNQPTVLILDKKVHGSDERLSGVEFRLWNKNEAEGSSQQSVQKEVYTTGEDGKVRIERLLPGTYCIQEIKGIPGYALDTKIYEFTIDEQGKIDGKGEAAIAIENRKTRLMKTQAVSADTQSQEAVTKKKTILKDRLTLSNLQPGETYRITGVLMEKESKTKLLAGQEPVTAQTEFTAEKSEQEIENIFCFDASALAGKTVVVFEKVFIGETEIASHEDLEDEAQSITFPRHKIQTSAKNQKTDSRQAAANKKITIKDTVTYENLIPGQEYTVKGTLMDKETGEEFFDGGRKVTAEKVFIPQKKNGTVHLEFTFNGSSLTGRKLVVFERLFVQNTEVAAHTDLQDEEQTVEFPVPRIGTKAENAQNKTQEAAAGKKITLIDTVEYENLIPGQEYTLKGILMEKETKKELLVNGKTVTAEKSFTPQKASGEIKMEFAFDASALTGKSLTVFERLYVEQTEIAVHTDFEDERQTIVFPAPEMKTSARDKATGKQEADPKEKMILVDIVKYENLVIGTKYTVKGILMDKETGEELRIKGKPVTAEKTFRAGKKAGDLEIEFMFDAGALGGKKLVVFERLYVDGIQVASHTDLNDRAQTVFIKEKEIPVPQKTKKKNTPETGDTAPIGRVFLGIFLAGTVLLTVGKKKKDT